MRSFLKKEDIQGKLKSLVEGMFARIPAGVGGKGKIVLSQKDFEKVLTKGVAWAIEKGYGEQDDLKYIESEGCMEGADPDKISRKAFQRGEKQLGTLGSGNHFLEIQVVDEIFDE